MPAYNGKEAQIVERIKKGELRFDPDLLWVVLHFINNRLAQIDLPLELLARHSENLTELQKQKLDTIKKHTAEIQSFLEELRSKKAQKRYPFQKCGVPKLNPSAEHRPPLSR